MLEQLENELKELEVIWQTAEKDASLAKLLYLKKKSEVEYQRQIDALEAQPLPKI